MTKTPWRRRNLLVSTQFQRFKVYYHRGRETWELTVGHVPGALAESLDLNLQPPDTESYQDLHEILKLQYPLTVTQQL